MTSAASQDSSWAGFDVGGQAVKAVLVDERGNIVARGGRATGLETDVRHLAAAIGSLADELSATATVADAVGIGLAGVMGADGVLHGSPNLPRLVGRPVQRELEEILGRATIVDNDANCAAFGEGLGGAADGVASYLLITLGSGIGSGLVLGGELHHGATGYACELGHSVVCSKGRLCGCGNRGCLEAYCSETAARALVAEASERLRAAVIADVSERGHGHAQSLFERADGGDDEARAITADMIEMLGIGLASAVNVLDVTVLVIGGGIAPGVLARKDELLAAMDASLFARDAASLTVVAAARGGDAGAVGAARLAMSAR